MEMIFKSAQDMTAAEMKLARRLTLDSGQMWDTLLDCRDRRYPKITGDVGFVYVDGKMVSWALAFIDASYGPRDARTVYFYTRPDYRRMGYGTAIFKKMKVRYKSFHVSPWDRNSAGFFEVQKINEKSRDLVDLIMSGAWDE